MIELQSICWSAGSFRLEDVSFVIPGNCYAMLMGRTGSGKTSILELICGLRPPQGGRIWIADEEVTWLPPARRGVGYVPQDGALFPTMTVARQIGFAPRLQGASAEAIRTRVEALARELGVDHLLDRKPGDLSGGEKQRVALGRALAAQPKVLILDEPLSALDEDTREEMAVLLQRTQREHQLTVLHITHSRWEADRLGDRVLRIDKGRICSGSDAETGGEAKP